MKFVIEYKKTMDLKWVNPVNEKYRLQQRFEKRKTFWVFSLFWLFYTVIGEEWRDVPYDQRTGMAIDEKAQYEENMYIESKLRG